MLVGAYEVQGEQPPWKQAIGPSERWEGDKNQKVRVGNKSSEIGVTMDDKCLIPILILEKREIVDKALADSYLCVKQKILLI